MSTNVEAARVSTTAATDRVTAPAYMEAFRCLGGDCPQTCCSGWIVSVDRGSYERFQTVAEPELRALLREHVRRRESGGTDRSYAVIASVKDGTCGLLSDRGLCRVHSELGAEYLADLCDQFPRQFRGRGSRVRMFGSLACPEAARLALADEAALEWRDLGMTPHRLGHITRRNAGECAADELADDRLDAVQCVAASIAAAVREWVTAPDVPVRFACQYAVWVAKDLVRAARTATDKATAADAVLAALERARAPGALETLAAAAGEGADATVFSDLSFVDAAVRDLYLKESPVPSFAVAGEAFATLGFDAGDAAGSVSRYRELRRKWFAPFDRRHPYVLRNWLLNSLGVYDYPAVGADALELHTLGLLLRFTLFETLLVGRAAQRRDAFSTSDCSTVAHAVARHFEHELGYRGTPLMGEA